MKRKSPRLGGLFRFQTGLAPEVIFPDRGKKGSSTTAFSRVGIIGAVTVPVEVVVQLQSLLLG